MKFRLIMATSLLLMQAEQSRAGDDAPKAPTPGNHILNPANQKQLLENIKKLEDENISLCKLARPNQKQIPQELDQDTIFKIESNIKYLKKLDTMQGLRMKI